MQVVAYSDSKEDQLKWLFILISRSGMVESRLRQLVMKLDLIDNLYFKKIIQRELSHPYMKGFEKVSKYRNDEEKLLAIRGNVNEFENKENSEVFDLYTTTFYIGLRVRNIENRRLDISWPIQEFTSLVKNWELFNEKSMNIVIQLLKR